jgi:hypothetical protein
MAVGQIKYITENVTVAPRLETLSLTGGRQNIPRFFKDTVFKGLTKLSLDIGVSGCVKM